MFFCDESDWKGKFCSNFFGGVRIGFSQYEGVTARLNQKKASLGLTSEPKWEKVDATTWERYAQLVTAFFDEIAAGLVCMRVMFRKNVHVPSGLTQEHHDGGYYFLYYQFIKHGFGAKFMPQHSGPVRFRIFLDEVSDTRERIALFRGYLAALAQMPELKSAGVILNPADITEVHSHRHVLLQCVDIILGSVTFRLNDKHKEIPKGLKRRGKRTVAKDKLCTHIHRECCRVLGRLFNSGVSTSVVPYPDGRWSMPYRHWCFIPKEHTIDSTKVKR